MDRVILFHYLIDMSAGWVARNKIVCKAGQRANHKNQLEQVLVTDYLHVDGGSALEPLPLHQRLEAVGGPGVGLQQQLGEGGDRQAQVPPRLQLYCSTAVIQ